MYRKDKYIKHLRELAEELGRTPTVKDTTLHNSIREYFGSWNNALIDAGLELNRQSRNLTKDDLLKLLEEGVGEEKHYISKSDWDEKNIVCSATLLRRFEFNSWDKMLEDLLGIENPVKRLKADRDAFMEELRIFLLNNKIKASKAYDEMRSKSMPSSSQIRYVLKLKWADILNELDIEGSKTIRTKEDLKKIILDLKDELNRSPSSNDVRKKFGDSTSIVNLVKKHFGSWNNCLNELGIKTRTTPTKVEYTNEELLKMYKDFSEELGMPATVMQINNNENMPNYESYKVRFGGMKELQELLGYEYTGTAMKKYTKKEIAKLLYDLRLAKGSKPTDKEVDYHLSTATILSYFHKTNMNDVWKCIDDLEEELK